MTPVLLAVEKVKTHHSRSAGILVGTLFPKEADTVMYLLMLLLAQTELPEYMALLEQVILRPDDKGNLGEADLFKVVPIKANKNFIYLTSEQSGMVAIFDRKGNFIKNVVRLGGGPEEIQSVGQIAVSEKFLIVLDGNNAKNYLLFDAPGHFLKKVVLRDGFIENNGIELMSDQYLLCPATYAFPGTGHTLSVRDLFSGKELCQVGRGGEATNIHFRLIAPAVAEGCVWTQIPFTRVFEKYDAMGKFLNGLHAPFSSSDVEFEISHFNNLLRQNKGTRLALNYAFSECRLPWRFFFLHGALLTWEFYYDQPTTFSFYHPESGKLIKRFRYEMSRADSPGLPVQVFADSLVLFQPSADEERVGTVSFVRFKIE